MSAAATPKKSVAKKVTNHAVPDAHLPVAQMVNAAIRALKDRNGSSLAAIKKYISVNYKADGQKLAPFISHYLKKTVETGKLEQGKGNGASGSFRINKAEKTEKTAKPAKKPAAARKAKKPAAKKVKTPKKETVKKAKTPKKAAKKTAAKKAAPKPKKSIIPQKKPAAKKTANK